MLFREIYGMTDDELFRTVSGEIGQEEAEYAALTERIASARHIDHQTVKLLAQQTDYLRTMDGRVGAPPLVDQMTGHLTTIQNALSHRSCRRSASRWLPYSRTRPHWRPGRRSTSVQ
jgi:hypothetical protein